MGNGFWDVLWLTELDASPISPSRSLRGRVVGTWALQKDCCVEAFTGEQPQAKQGLQQGEPATWVTRQCGMLCRTQVTMPRLPQLPPAHLPARVEAALLNQ